MPLPILVGCSLAALAASVGSNRSADDAIFEADMADEGWYRRWDEMAASLFFANLVCVLVMSLALWTIFQTGNLIQTAEGAAGGEETAISIETSCTTNVLAQVLANLVAADVEREARDACARRDEAAKEAAKEDAAGGGGRESPEPALSYYQRAKLRGRRMRGRLKGALGSGKDLTCARARAHTHPLPLPLPDA